MLDYIRIACAVPAVKAGDVKKNVEDICTYIHKADAENADLVVFPELAMTGYTCGDLFYQETLHNAVEEGLGKLLEVSEKYPDREILLVDTLGASLGASAFFTVGATAKTCSRDLIWFFWVM